MRALDKLFNRRILYILQAIAIDGNSVNLTSTNKIYLSTLPPPHHPPPPKQQQFPQASLPFENTWHNVRGSQEMCCFYNSLTAVDFIDDWLN
jgi:hypothetical protein